MRIKAFAARGLVSAVVALAITLKITAPAAAASLYTVPKYAAILINSADGEVLYARQADAPRYPASITKVMTLYVAFEELRDGNIRESDMIRISTAAARQPPSKLGLKPGAKISVREAMGIIATKSANDLAVALGEYISGSESQFAARMTQTAAGEGLTYDFDPLQHTNTLKAHELLHLAKAHGLQEQMTERLMRAYFTEGRHLGRIPELADLLDDPLR